MAIDPSDKPAGAAAATRDPDPAASLSDDTRCPDPWESPCPRPVNGLTGSFLAMFVQSFGMVAVLVLMVLAVVASDSHWPWWCVAVPLVLAVAVFVGAQRLEQRLSAIHERAPRDRDSEGRLQAYSATGCFAGIVAGFALTMAAVLSWR